MEELAVKLAKVKKFEDILKSRGFLGIKQSHNNLENNLNKENNCKN